MMNEKLLKIKELIQARYTPHISEKDDLERELILSLLDGVDLEIEVLSGRVETCDRILELGDIALASVTAERDAALAKIPHNVDKVDWKTRCINANIEIEELKKELANLNEFVRERMEG